MLRLLGILLALLVAIGIGLFAVFGKAAFEPACRQGDPAAIAASGAGVEQFKATDGVCLQRYSWSAEAAAPRAVVVIVHGIRDHAQRYAVLAKSLRAAGYEAYAADLRGHGLSGGARQVFGSLDQLVSDVDATVEAAKAKHPGLPVFIYGHSLGGLITATYVRAHGPKVAGAVLSGPALKLRADVSATTQSIVQFVGAYLPALPLQPSDDTVYVRTAEAKKELAADPLIVHSNLPALSAKAGLDGIASIQARMGEISVPLFIMHGGADPATNVDGSRDLAARAASADKTLKIYDGVAHDLMHEPERDQIIADVLAWLNAHVK